MDQFSNPNEHDKCDLKHEKIGADEYLQSANIARILRSNSSHNV